jgi:hypothetical protein
MTLAEQNRQFSILMGACQDYEYDPFQPDLKLSLRDKFMLNRIMTEFKLNMPERIVKFIDSCDRGEHSYFAKTGRHPPKIES